MLSSAKPLSKLPYFLQAKISTFFNHKFEQGFPSYGFSSLEFMLVFKPHAVKAPRRTSRTEEH